jgi:DNA-binding MarR family transcriptional regulator
MVNELFSNIAKLGIKMRVFRAIQIADTEAGALKDREILILELLKTQGPMNMSELSRFFPGVKLSTLSTDIKKLRSEMDLIDMKVDKHDMRIHIIELSGKGFEKVDEILAQRAKSYIPLSKAIGNDPEELALLNRIVDRAITMVDSEINKFVDAEKL